MGRGVFVSFQRVSHDFNRRDAGGAFQNDWVIRLCFRTFVNVKRQAQVFLHFFR